MGSERPLRKELFVIIVISHPKPRHQVAFENADSAVPEADPNRSNGFSRIGTLETKRRMKGVRQRC